MGEVATVPGVKPPEVDTETLEKTGEMVDAAMEKKDEAPLATTGVTGEAAVDKLKVSGVPEAEIADAKARIEAATPPAAVPETPTPVAPTEEKPAPKKPWYRFW